MKSYEYFVILGRSSTFIVCRSVCVLKVADEFYNRIGWKKAESVKIIVSSHNLENTPSMEEIGNLAATIQASGADIVKISTTALDITDSARLLQLLLHSQVTFQFTTAHIFTSHGSLSQVYHINIDQNYD